VLENIESLCDHQYIEVALKCSNSYRNNKLSNIKRWNFKRLDAELYIEALEFLVSAKNPDVCFIEPEEYANWITKIVSNACNIVASIVTRRNRKRQVYWWSEKISDLRLAAIRAKRVWCKSKRKRGLDALDRGKDYKVAKKLLRSAIQKAKNSSWRELVATIEKDPWGLPYRLVMGKLRSASSTLTEVLDANSLAKLLESLFPQNVGHVVTPENFQIERMEEMEVTFAEVVRFVRKRAIGNVAPGPDNLKAIAWKKVPNSIMGHIMGVLTGCLMEGVFPRSW